MIFLAEVLAAWNTPAFENQLKSAIEQMTVDQLPLQQGLANSGYALDTNLKAVLISTAELADYFQATVGIFYTGVIAGCNCADDPTPVDELPEYCVVEVAINKLSAATTICLIDE